MNVSSKIPRSCKNISIFFSEQLNRFSIILEVGEIRRDVAFRGLQFRVYFWTC